jgi:plasmid maintenance system killer protein
LTGDTTFDDSKFRHKGLKRLYAEGRLQGILGGQSQRHWRVIFCFDEAPDQVDLVDYH